MDVLPAVPDPIKVNGSIMRLQTPGNKSAASIAASRAASIYSGVYSAPSAASSATSATGLGTN